MSFKSPPDIAEAGAATGLKKATLTWDKALVGSFLAGAYIAFAGLLAVVCSAGMNPNVGTIALVTGSVFALGLVLVIIAGSELLTGNMALLPMALLSRRLSAGRFTVSFVIVLVGNLLGSLFVAYFLAVKSGVITADAPLARLSKIATAKGVTESGWQIFLRAIGCNWLVCLAVWMALGADDIGGKVLAIFFPIMGFVAMGFDHVVANMFFLPAAIFAHVPGIGWGDALRNWLFAFLGNFVGGAVFVGGAYHYLYLRRGEAGEPSAGGVRADGALARGAEGQYAGAGSSSRPSA